jgi:hypothetical protein
MISKILAIRLRPFEDESLPSYLCRLATVNGWGSTAEFLVIMGIKKTKVDPNYNLYRLAQLTNISLAVFEPLVDEIPQTMPERMFYHHSPRFCPVCIEKEPFIRHNQHYQTQIYCVKHQCKIIEKCPTCQHPLSWKSTLFSHCQYCEQKWVDLCCIDKIDDDYQCWIEQGNSDEKMQLLYHAITRLVYPTDLDPLALTYKLVIDSRYILDAFYLLQRRLDNIWANRCNEDRHYLSLFGEHLVQSPLNVLRSSIGLPSASNETISHWPSYTQQARTDKYPNLTVDLVYRASSSTIRQLLGLSALQLRIFEDSGHFDSLYHISNTKHRTYDMRQIYQWFEMRISKDKCDYFPELSFKKLLMMYGIEFSRLFEGIHQADFRITLTHYNEQLVLKLAAEDVKNFVKENEVFDPQEDKPQKWVARRLRIHNKGVNDLICPGLLACTRNRDITRASLHTLLLNYSSLQRWCYLHSYKRTKVVSLMAEANIIPIFNSPFCTLLTHEQLKQLAILAHNREDIQLENHPKWVL